MDEKQEQALIKLNSLRGELVAVPLAVSKRILTARFMLSLLDKKRATPCSVSDEYFGYADEISMAVSLVKHQEIPQATAILTDLKACFDNAAKPRDTAHYGGIGKLGKEIKTRERFPAYSQKVADVLKLL
jgi:hypothetical protein